ncbi:hypothetical protein MKZ17_02520 [Solibacillus sp. FSL R7-0682]|uniref:hypothetical protein n=1 Tax=Solibacillus sp. FSL R7-0682 TaxID=2921690 RepID=UPI0030F94E59
MISENERKNMVHFLIMYCGSNPNQLQTLNDYLLERTYDFAYSRTIMECDF